ncbi:MAG: class I SAM-dependent rRNA methyltransferase, partial [Anaerolineae bacterium]|nr:class I SAM-dependent rRNA methyltransferase [Anaerolineae bacterium]
MADLFLKNGREKAVQNRHPWVFSGAVDRIKGDVSDGDVVTVRDTHGQFLASGYLNARSQIVVRLLSWDQDEPIDDAFWLRRIAGAVARRQSLANDGLTTAYRLIYAESDLLPGLVVDRYGEFLVVQCLTLGIDQRRGPIVQGLANLLSPQGIYERSDVDVRKLEGLDQVCGVVYGDEPPQEIEIAENGHRFLVDLKNGQKTGFYLDQRENRQTLARYAGGGSLLNVFAYSGAFSVYAASAGAGPVVNLDSSEDALGLAKRNMRLNGLSRTQDEYEVGSAFDLLREYRD